MAAAAPAFSNTWRLSVASSSRNLRRKLASRGFSSSVRRCAASNYVMPAMSPTMSEGNIAAWKVKEGDSFSAGDVLLEIETDKAQMDVEAQEDGILAKIVQGDGTKGIKVGMRIAVMAEEGDDLSSLEMPADEPAKSQPSEKEQKPEESSAPAPQESKSAAAPSEGTSSRKPSGGKPQQQKYPLYPSVAHLLHTSNIPLSDASKIPATGPAGRLLKGDVLSYLNAIPPDYSAEQSARLEKLSHLDLSNIKKHVPAPPKPEPSASPPAAAAAAALSTEIAVPISFAAVLETQARLRSALGLDLSLSTFIARASEIANENLPRARAPASADELFDAVLGLPAARGATSRGRYVPQITALAPAGVPAPRRARDTDVIDALVGAAPKHATRLAMRGAAGAVSSEGRNVFSVPAQPGEEARVRTYLERVKSVLEAEPGRCVL